MSRSYFQFLPCLLFLLQLPLNAEKIPYKEVTGSARLYQSSFYLEYYNSNNRSWYTYKTAVKDTRVFLYMTRYKDQNRTAHHKFELKPARYYGLLRRIEKIYFKQQFKDRLIDYNDHPYLLLWNHSVDTDFKKPDMTKLVEDYTTLPAGRYKPPENDAYYYMRLQFSGRPARYMEYGTLLESGREINKLSYLLRYLDAFLIPRKKLEKS